MMYRRWSIDYLFSQSIFIFKKATTKIQCPNRKENIQYVQSAIKKYQKAWINLALNLLGKYSNFSQATLETSNKNSPGASLSRRAQKVALTPSTARILGAGHFAGETEGTVAR